VVIFVHNIERALSVLDPANAEGYVANAVAYEAELEALDKWVFAQIKTIPAENRKFVADHSVFGYYADRYGLEQIGAVVTAFSTAAEPSAQELAALEDAIRETGIKAVFVGTTVNPSLAKQVAEDTGARLVPLYTGSLGSKGSGVETYIGYTCSNTVAIVDALGGKAVVEGSSCE
jgi:ABC-type Zn uptake system ZnuABC Zn-binding protein ZnuA